MAKVKSKVTLNGEIAFPSDFLSAVEFKGKDVTLTISAVTKEQVQMTDGSKKAKMVLRFEKTAKKLIANRTNADSIAQLYGTEASGWVNKRVTFYPTRCLAFGEMVDCVRVREKKPSNGQAETGLDAQPDQFDDGQANTKGDE